MNINELEELAKSASQGEWVCSGFIVSAKDSGYVPIADTELDNESMSENAAYIAAANPVAISELIAAYREAVAALKHYAQEDIRNARHYPPEFAKDVLATAKRLGVE